MESSLNMQRTVTVGLPAEVWNRVAEFAAEEGVTPAEVLAKLAADVFGAKNRPVNLLLDAEEEEEGRSSFYPIYSVNCEGGSLGAPI